MKDTVTVLLGTVAIRKVLDQCAAERDVQHLETPTDRQGRDVVAHRGTREGDVERVDVGIDAGHRLVRVLAVLRGVDVASADEHERVEAAEELVGLGIGERHREQRRFLTARAPDRIEVPTRARQDVCPRSLQVLPADEPRAHGDQGAHGSCLPALVTGARSPLAESGGPGHEVLPDWGRLLGSRFTPRLGGSR